MGILDRLVPPRLGREFRRLLAAFYAGQLGDGIALAAGPLLVASQTIPIIAKGVFKGFTDRLSGRGTGPLLSDPS